MRYRIIDIKDDVQIFPTIGVARLTPVTDKGNLKELDIPLSKADKLSQKLMAITTTGRELGLAEGYAWPLMGTDVVTEHLPVSGFRLLPNRETGDLGVQFMIQGGGIAALLLSDEIARQLVDQAPDQLTDFKVTRDRDEVNVSVAASTYMDVRRTKLPSAPLAIPERFCAVIGKIVATWGQFESIFESLLAAIIKANGNEASVPGKGFKRRRERFKAEMKVAFASSPDLTNYLIGILDDAADLYWRRNVIAHGEYSSEVSIKKAENSEHVFVDVKMLANGTHNNKPVQLTFDKSSLEDLYYKIAHLAGRIQGLSTPERALSAPLPPQDISALRDLLLANRPDLPSATKPPSQRVSSQE